MSKAELSAGSATVGCMVGHRGSSPSRHRSSHPTNNRSSSDLLMLSGVTATCADCGAERVFVPIGETASPGEFCCTSCDAAIFLLAVADPAPDRRSARVA